MPCAAHTQWASLTDSHHGDYRCVACADLTTWTSKLSQKLSAYTRVYTVLNISITNTIIDFATYLSSVYTSGCAGKLVNEPKLLDKRRNMEIMCKSNVERKIINMWSAAVTNARWFAQIRFAQLCESSVLLREASVELREWSYAQSKVSNCRLIPNLTQMYTIQCITRVRATPT